VIATVHAARAAGPLKFAGPGPTTISPEEAAIRPDPAQHLEEAVVLLQEIEARDFYGKTSADFGTGVHQRIKVLSDDARIRVHVSFVQARAATQGATD
jgi:hypothetical protein